MTAWAKTAEAICKYMEKGRELFVFGELKLDRWEAQDGSKRQKLKVVANFVQFLGGKGGGERRDGSPPPTDEDRPPQRGSQRDDDFNLEDDVPF